MPTEVCLACGGTGFVTRNVAWDHPDFGKPLPCANCTQPPSVEQIGLAMGFNAEMQSKTFERWDFKKGSQQHYDTALAFAEGRLTPWLLVVGNYGVGKTYMALCIANHRIYGRERVKFVASEDLLKTLRSGYQAMNPNFQSLDDETMGRLNAERKDYETLYAEFRAVPLLVIDDLGRENLTEWAREQLEGIIGYRYERKLELVVTCNDPKKLEAQMPRVADRLMDKGVCTVIKRIAPSNRSGKLW